MTRELVEDIIEAFHLTSRTVSSLPKLPSSLKMGMFPVLAALRRIQDEEGKAKVTDISKYLKVTSPYIIRIVGQCARDGYIEKWQDENDKRVMNIRLTREGQRALEECMDIWHDRLREKFEKIDDREWEIVVKVLHQAHDMVNEACAEIDHQLPEWKQR